MNGYLSKTDQEQSSYQKRVERIENVILCVAEAEKMVASIGKTLFPGLERVVKRAVVRRRVANMPWRTRDGFMK